MSEFTVKQLFASVPTEPVAGVTVSGWVRTMRESKTFAFIELNDGSYFKNLQVVLEDEKLSNYKEIAKQNIGCALIVTGVLVLTPDAKQPFELKAETVEVEGASTPDYPLQKKRHTMEYLRTIAHLRPRANTFNAVFRVRSVAAYHSQVLPGTRLRLCQYAHHHRL